MRKICLKIHRWLGLAFCEQFFFKNGISAYMPTRFCHSDPMVIAFLALSSLHDAYTKPTSAYTILRLYSVLTRIY